MVTTGNAERVVLRLDQVDGTCVAAVGGKGAQLGELARIDGVQVPPGLCVTNDAFRRIMADAPSIPERLDRLSHLAPDDRDAIRRHSAEIREVIEAIAVPDDVADAVTAELARLGDAAAYAVRSSATAEDLPTASFAGQHDSYLNVVGAAPILRHVGRCWASLFTERAVTYRLAHGIDHRQVQMAVVVQRMAFADAAGVAFTADPVTSNRTIVRVEATFGLGEALVSGRVDPDVVTVRDGEVVDRVVATKQIAVLTSPAGGTHEVAIDPARQDQPVLTDALVLRLAQLGRRIEAHLGCPQDIEWCLVGDDLQIVQSRPITTLFPIPERDDEEMHVYVSVGHQQMMTEPMKPLGLSLWQLTAARPMYEAGGRLFVDVTLGLASPASRAGLLELLGRGDPLIGDALRAIVDRGDVLPTAPEGGPGDPPLGGAAPPIEADPAIVAELVERNEASLAALEREIATRSGSALLDLIRADVQELRRVVFDPRSMQVIMAAMQATWWLNDRLLTWLGETNAADVLTRSAPGNVTSEMGLALLDVADVVRDHPAVVTFLRDVDDDGFVERLATVEGGTQARDALRAYLDAYGMRGVGEIDITRPRWSEQPLALVPAILADVDGFEPGAHRRLVEQGLRDAQQKEHDVLQRLRALPDGGAKADEAKQMIDRVRAFIGYREYPKYAMVRRYFAYKQALLGEADRLVEAGVLGDREDIFFLAFDELDDVVRTGTADERLIRDRREAFASHRALTPPRVMTSDGEIVVGSYRRHDVPTGALAGLAVSSGTVEGRARVVLDMAAADLGPGDILVTTSTDPSWSPLFVSIAGLVTEVGGLMTHGAVIAREYGLPAVVGVQDATQVIRDGQQIRLDGTHGWVEVIS
ncbi:MAG: rifamycin-inactivating phosphotransferase [Acidimicrobiales bacterium]